MVRLPPRSTRTATLFPFTTPVRSTRIDEPGLAVRTVFNPFYTVADNIGSCYVARHEMDDPFVLLNGDTVIEPGIVETLLRSEEHTSELQSLMRISYAVFCLKKKRKINNQLNSIKYTHKIQQINL